MESRGRESKHDKYVRVAKRKEHRDPHLLYPLDISSEYVVDVSSAEPEMQISSINQSAAAAIIHGDFVEQFVIMC